MRRLLIRPGAIGDCIASLPALECLCSGYTEVWVARQNVPLIRFASRVRSIASTGLDLLEIAGQAPPPLIETLRSFDSIVSWYGSNREEFRSALRAVNPACRFFSALPAAMHAVDFYLEQARGVASCYVAAIPRVPCPRKPGNFAVIHPFSGGKRKNWPIEKFRSLAGWLSARLPVEWCAGPEEALDEARRFDDLYELACWLASARLYIGNDSGISHLAAAVGTPAIALFGPSDPAIWSPRGSQVRTVQLDPVDRIEVQQVTAAVSEVMGWS